MSIIDAHKEGINSGQILALESLLDAIELHKVTEVCQVEKMINGVLNALKGDEYEREANLDHLTSRSE